MKKLFFVALCLIVATGLSGCAKSNAVRLTYSLGALPTSCPGNITIFKFSDERSTSNLGKDSTGATITSASDVADWVGWAFFDEIKAAGCAPKYRTSTVAPDDAPLLTGEVLELSLNQTGTTTYAGKVSVKIMLEKAGKTVLLQSYSSEVEDIVMLGYGNESQIMEKALCGLIAEALPAICRHL